MGESSWIFHHPSFSLSGTESLSSGLSTALLLLSGQWILLESNASSSVQILLSALVHLESPGSRLYNSHCLLVPVLWELNSLQVLGTSGQGVPGWGCWERLPFTSESVGAVREGLCGCRVFCTAPSMAGFRFTTESAGCCCSADE